MPIIPVTHDSEDWERLKLSHTGPVIQLTHGLVSLVDEADYNLLSSKRWFAVRGRKTFYAQHTAWGGRNITVRMHRLILSAPAGIVVDHINGCGLDNRRSNLRLCRMAQNSWNQSKRPGSSPYRGVTLSPTGNRWHAQICVNGKLRRIGSFLTAESAAAAYDAAAKESYGEFARPNFQAVK